MSQHVVESMTLPPQLAQAASYDEEFPMPDKTEYPVAISAWPTPRGERVQFTVKVRAYDQTSAMNAMRDAVLGGANPKTGKPYKLWYKLQQLAPRRQYAAIHFE
jgi:hypothetical protein